MENKKEDIFLVKSFKYTCDACNVDFLQKMVSNVNATRIMIYYKENTTDKKIAVLCDCCIAQRPKTMYCYFCGKTSTNTIDLIKKDNSTQNITVVCRKTQCWKECSKDDSALKLCTCCGNIPEKILRCSQCKKAYYCNVECQKKDHPVHKSKCFIPQD